MTPLQCLPLYAYCKRCLSMRLTPDQFSALGSGIAVSLQVSNGLGKFNDSLRTSQADGFLKVSCQHSSTTLLALMND